jgi:hypothetical protein
MAGPLFCHSAESLVYQFGKRERAQLSVQPNIGAGDHEATSIIDEGDKNKEGSNEGSERYE